MLTRSKPCSIAHVLLGAVLLSGCQSIPVQPSLLRNEALPSIKPSYLGNTYNNGKFDGLYSSVSSGGESFWNYARWKLNPYRAKGTQEIHSNTRVLPYSPSQHYNQPHITWLGHSTILVRLKDTTILIDPILNSPKLFHGKRLVALPVQAKELSADLLLATHAHRDHLDKRTIKELIRNGMKAFVPLKMGSLLRQWRPDIDVVEAGWYQTFTTVQGLEITLLPAKHWSRRSIFDTNSTLWGSYLITDGDTSIFIAGDTGYADHFKEIGVLFSDIDYAVLPIGSYNPSHLHHNNHMTPEESLLAFQDLKAKVMIPVHYGTYDLSDEPVAEPLQRLEAEMARQQLTTESVQILSIGEVRPIN